MTHWMFVKCPESSMKTPLYVLEFSISLQIWVLTYYIFQVEASLVAKKIIHHFNKLAFCQKKIDIFWNFKKKKYV